MNISSLFKQNINFLLTKTVALFFYLATIIVLVNKEDVS